MVQKRKFAGTKNNNRNTTKTNTNTHFILSSIIHIYFVFCIFHTFSIFYILLRATIVCILKYNTRNKSSSKYYKGWRLDGRRSKTLGHFQRWRWCWNLGADGVMRRLLLGVRTTWSNEHRIDG